MKKCFKCGETKPLSEFYKHKMMSDGHLGKCKECTKRDVRVHRINSERPREYDRERYQKNPKRRKYTVSVAHKHRLKNPDAYRARYAVSNAVRDGRLKKPEKCEICGGRFWLHGHHDDYSKPLDVIWLCAKCHHGKHANENL